MMFAYRPVVADEKKTPGLVVAPAAHGGAIVRGLLVRHHPGLDDVAERVARGDAVQRGEADDGYDEEHDQGRQHAEDPTAGDAPLEQDPTLGRFAFSHESPAMNRR